MYYFFLLSIDEKERETPLKGRKMTSGEGARFLKRGRKFTNPHRSNTLRKPWHVLLWKIGYYNDPVPRRPPPEGFIYPTDLPVFQPDLPSCVWINHCTFLINADQQSILTDPVWSKYCSPVPIRGLRRKHLPGMPLEDLPNLDLILISHNHYDHLDEKTVRALIKDHPQTRWIVPLGLKKWFRRRGIDAHELGWWDTTGHNSLQITAVPSQHFSGRGAFDTNKSLWNGYVVKFTKSGKKLYFCGDTGYNSQDFKNIGSKWNQMDLSLIPIGTYSPEKFMKPVHIGPSEAVQIHKDVASRFSIGMHWKTFRLSDEPMDLPPYELYLSMKEAQLPLESFIALDHGKYVNW